MKSNAILVVSLLFFASACEHPFTSSAQTAREPSARPAKTPDQVQSSAASPSHLPEIMILGVYHMSNPGLDSVNLAADDPRSPRRQTELQALSQELGAYKPTKILVEAPWGSVTLEKAYEAYVAGTESLSTNEVQQIGFRLAKEQKLRNVIGVDYPMFMSGLRADEVGPLRPPGAADAAPSTAPEHRTAPQNPDDAVLQQSSVSEYLRRINDPVRAAQLQANMLSMLKPSADHTLYQSADLLTNWYKRNLRIVSNVERITEPEDRILILIGAGHLITLHDLLSESHQYEMVDPLVYLKPAALPVPAKHLPKLSP